jgi:hypothetical protein
MGTTNSSKETRERSKRLAAEIGSYHLGISIDGVVAAMVDLFATITGAPNVQGSRGFKQLFHANLHLWLT